MSSIEPTGATGPQAQPPSSQDAKLLNSPFAKMFRASGVQPTVKEIQSIINGILKQQINQIKREDTMWKKAMQKIKKEIDGDD